MAGPRMNGHCLCGAVRVSGTPTDGVVTACNCDNCRRWTGGVNFTFPVDPDTARIEGPVKYIAPLPWAERGFCAECGSGVCYRVTAGKQAGFIKVAAGLFDDLSGLKLGTEYFIEKRPAIFDLGQDHPTMTAAEVEALFAGQE